MTGSFQAYVPQVALDQVLPFALLIGAGLVILALDALLDFARGMTPARRDNILCWVTGISLLGAGFTHYADFLGANSRPFLEGAFRADAFGNLGALVIILAALAFVVMSPSLIRRRRLPAGELYALLLFSCSGMTMLTVANELVTAFICIEILSLALYVMAGIDRRSRRGGEAAFKYFILGAFASAFLVFGIAFLYGATGTTQLFGQGATYDRMMAAERLGMPITLPLGEPTYNMGINEVLHAGQRVVTVSQPVSEIVDGQVVVTDQIVSTLAAVNPMWLFLGFALVFVGLCFKLSLAPFHMWAPDVYEGAPTLSAMFIATASKVAAFAFLVHLVEAMSFWSHFPAASGFLIGGVAMVSILWGNLGAVVQSNFKRLLAYSSIAHGGYLTIAIATLVHPEVFGDYDRIERVRSAILFYLFAYTAMNILAFGVAAYLGARGEGDIRNYRGLFRRRPAVALAMALSMLSLMGLGIPLLIGFWGKMYVFKEAIDVGLISLVIVGAAGNVVSAFYYLRVVVEMFMRDDLPADAPPEESPRGLAFPLVLVASSALVVLFGFLPPLFLALGGR
ncbi:MAG: NADH-quinone oxidoreductase subunit N [Candidatus Sumerlaeia bacterium]|nr:NADH-quinone oxidoreductase subunit N [Candidatus Sumerlaeia bacterium]